MGNDNKKIKIVYVFTACKKLGPVQQTLNIIRNLDRTKFTPYLITIYPEPKDNSSQLSKYIECVESHSYVPLTKLDVVLGYVHSLEGCIDNIGADVVQTLGVFPNYAVANIGKYRHITTIRNFLYEDYIPQYGYLKGKLLGWLNLCGLKKTSKAVTCSKSLSDKWLQSFGLKYDYIRNGVEFNDYYPMSDSKKRKLRKKLELPFDKKIVTYTGILNDRKDQRFLISVFRQFSQLHDVILLLLGGGELFDELKNMTRDMGNVILAGQVMSVCEYLNASDVYISTSKSEGMPNGVLEAMACGLPIVLSDIEQHKEIFDECSDIGYLYEQGNVVDCGQKLLQLLSEDFVAKGKISEKLARGKFSAEEMSKKYQKLYFKMAGEKVKMK